MSAVLSTDMKIKQLCKKTGEPGFHNYTEMQGNLLSAIIDLNLYSMPCWSVATLPITQFNTINWPCDCVKPLYTVLTRNKCNYLLSVSDDLLQVLKINPVQNPPAQTCTISDLFQIDGFLEAYSWNIWAWGLGELYGAETMRPPFGIVIPDKKRRQSFIKGFQILTGDVINLFFKSTGLEDCPLFIPAEADQVVEYFMLMKWYETRNPNLADDFERKYKERTFRLERWNQDGDEDQWVRALNSNSLSSPKY